jgi:periplasmic protein TonB
MRSTDHHASLLTVFSEDPGRGEELLLEAISNLELKITDLGPPLSIRNGASSTIKSLPCLDLSFLRGLAPLRERTAVPHAPELCAPATEMPLAERPPEPSPGTPPLDEMAPPLLQTAQKRLSRLTRVELALGVGLSLWLHLAVLLGALLLPGTPPCAAPETHFVMVNLLEGGAGGAGGMEGSGNGRITGIDHPGDADTPPPPGQTTTGGSESVPSSAEVKPERALSEMPREPVKPDPVPAPVQPKKCAIPTSTKTANTQPTRLARAKPVEAVAEPSAINETSAPPNPAGKSAAAEPSSGIVSDQARQGFSGKGEAAAPGPGEGGAGKHGSGHSAPGTGNQNTFALNQVDQPPVVVRKVEPEFPAAARKMDLSGRVVAKFLVKPDGHVSNVTILEMHPSGIFEQSVIEALTKWEFKPGIYRDKPVSTWVVLPVRFRLAR